MKKIIVGFLVGVSFISTTALASVAIKKIEIMPKDNIATVYGGNDDIKIYEVKMASSTCYVSINTNTASKQHNLSCVK